MRAEKRTKIALDENRMSILGVQILFGFQLQAPFHKLFDALPETSRHASLLAFGLLIAAAAALIAPSAYHRIITGGGIEEGLQHGITWLIDIALVLLALAIGLDLYIVGEHTFGGIAGLIFGIGFGSCAFLFWYGLELMHRAKRPAGTRSKGSADGADSKLEDRIDFVLTESRVILPGVQALLGFQLIVVLTETFGKLPPSSALVHLIALAAIALSAVLLIAPAAHHRIVFNGEDSEEFLPIASAYILGATVFLALGMAADCYVIVALVLDCSTWGIASAAATAILCLGLWHIGPLLMKKMDVPDAKAGARH